MGRGGTTNTVRGRGGATNIFRRRGEDIQTLGAQKEATGWVEGLRTTDIMSTQKNNRCLTSNLVVFKLGLNARF